MSVEWTSLLRWPPLHRGQSRLAHGSPTIWLPLPLRSSPSPSLLSPQRGNFPHFCRLMLFPPLKCPSRPHPLERSAKPRRRLLPPLGVTTFPSPPGPDHTVPAPPQPGASGGPPYTSPKVRPTRPSSRRPGTLPSPDAQGKFPEEALGPARGAPSGGSARALGILGSQNGQDLTSRHPSPPRRFLPKSRRPPWVGEGTEAPRAPSRTRQRGAGAGHRGDPRGPVRPRPRARPPRPRPPPRPPPPPHPTRRHLAVHCGRARSPEGRGKEDASGCLAGASLGPGRRSRALPLRPERHRLPGLQDGLRGGAESLQPFPLPVRAPRPLAGRSRRRKGRKRRKFAALRKRSRVLWLRAQTAPLQRLITPRD